MRRASRVACGVRSGMSMRRISSRRSSSLSSLSSFEPEKDLFRILETISELTQHSCTGQRDEGRQRGTKKTENCIQLILSPSEGIHFPLRFNLYLTTCILSLRCSSLETRISSAHDSETCRTWINWRPVTLSI